MPRRSTQFARECSNARDVIRAEKRCIILATRATIIEILRRGSVYDSEDPKIVKWAYEEQERIAKRLERSLEK